MATTVPFRIGPMRSRVDIEAVKVLWKTYGELFREGLGAQDVAADADRLPGGYLEPDGLVLVAYVGEAAAGTVAFQRLSGTTCRMRRLYVDELWRGRGLGRVLAATLLEAAKDMGYQRMVLDTTPEMAAARALYRRLGFEEVAQPDWTSPCRDPVFMQTRL